MGVDHTITLCIRYYAVPQAGPQHTTNTILNPHYNPDLLTYLNENEFRDADSDEDDNMEGPVPYPAAPLHRRL